MANTDIPEYLQNYGQAAETGCLSVTSALNEYASIFLLEGEVVYAETDQDFGVTALFIAMTWEGAQVMWEDGKQPPRLIMREPYDGLLFQYAQLEDSGMLDPDSIRSSMGDNVGEAAVAGTPDVISCWIFLNMPFLSRCLTLHLKGSHFIWKNVKVWSAVWRTATSSCQMPPCLGTIVKSSKNPIVSV